MKNLIKTLMKTLFQFSKHFILHPTHYSSKAQVFVKADAVGSNNGSFWSEVLPALKKSMAYNLFMYTSFISSALRDAALGFKLSETSTLIFGSRAALKNKLEIMP